jgi:sugar/nucleoside kinase (ribokinase family)
MERKGILAAGNFIVDVVKLVNDWPQQESLTDIVEQSFANGGGAYNLLKDLAFLKLPIPLKAIGLVGQDAYGQRIIEDCTMHQIDVSDIQKTPLAATSFTDVITVKDNGKRTFFHNRGANALLDIQHLNLGQSNARIFYLAYLLLLDKLDEMDENGMTGAAKVFKTANDLGFITATDLVSINRADFKPVIEAALPFIDYLFLNEVEAARLTGFQTEKDGNVMPDALIASAQELLRQGVRRWVVLHHCHGAVAVSNTGQVVWQGSVCMPQNAIRGTVGAGDAFAAGVLAGVHEGLDMQFCLEQGVCVAAASLRHVASSDGVKPLQDCLALGKKYGYYPTGI